MKIWFFTLLAVLWAGAFLYSHTPAVYSAADNPEAQVLVKYKSTWRQPTQGGRKVTTLKTGTQKLQYATRAEAAQAAERLSHDGAVAYAEVNTASVQPLLTPNDPGVSSQWYLSTINAPAAWDYQAGSNSTKIAIVDTGIDGTHTDLTGKVLAGKNFVSSANTDLAANSDSDPCGHGTAVAGLAAASSNNSAGIAGLDWQARLLPIRIIDDSPSLNCEFGFIDDLIEAITYAADQGAKIINVSLGTTENSQALRDAVVYAKNRGSMVVAAAGNGGSLVYPAGFPEAVAVGASNQADVVASFSSAGPELDLVAPGVSIHTTCDPDGSDLSCTVGDPYAGFSGTSASTPIVAGALGLALARNPGMVGQDFITAAQNGVDKVAGMGGANFTTNFGYGRLNTSKMLWAFQDYHASYVSQNGYPTIPRGSSYKFSVTLRNTGKSSWYRDDPFYPVNLGTDRARDRTPGFIREGGNPSGWRSANRIILKDSAVTPGTTGTFEFWYTTPGDKGFGTYREYFRAVADGWNWLEDWGIYWDVRVVSLPDSYHAQFIGQDAHPTLRRNQSIGLEVRLKNTEVSTWQKGVVNLGTDRGRDRIPGFIREDRVGGNPSGWISANRVQLVEDSVPPGGVGTFRFWYTAPSDKAFGTYREYFRVVADGITWMEDYGIYWDVTVVP